MKKKNTGDTQDTFEDHMMNLSETLSRADASRSLPKEGDRLTDYTGKITRTCEQSLVAALKPYQAATGDSERASLTEKRSRLEKKLTEKEHELHTLKMDRQQLTGVTYEHTKTWHLHAVSWIIAGSESFFVLKSFAYSEHLQNWVQVPLFIGLTAIFYAATKALWRLYKNTRGTKNGIYILGGLVVIVAMALYLFSSLRSLRVANVQDTTLENVGTVHNIPYYYYWGISIFLLAIGVAVTAQLPDSDEKGVNYHAKTLDTKIAECQKTIEKIEAELDAMPDKIASIATKESWQIAEASSLRIKYNAMHAACIAHYVQINRTYRPDAPPNCLNDQIPELTISI